MSVSQPEPPNISRTWSTAEGINKRPREQGVDYDEYGAEMEPNARVWKVYVDETDKADRELVDGWNSAMDVMLVFAALYSAVLTAFVIESSKDLKPDYSEISALTLLAISKTLASPAATPSDGGPGLPQIDLPNFVPTQAAIVVNTLWFLSLGLSIAVTLIAILAKEWCYSFMTRRTGAKLIQGRLRQKRWDGIKYWKMEEIISTLPLLMHIALLLFAIGLSVYLWNINPKVSVPVVLTTIMTVLYYTVTGFLPLFYRYCPYTTAIFRLFHPLWAIVFKSIYARALFQILIMTPAWLFLRIHDFKDQISGKIQYRDRHENKQDPETASMNSSNTLYGHIQEFEKRFYHRIERMHKDFLVDRSQTTEEETPMDKATSAMLLWMITNCEDPKSVDLAFQALAGADVWLPCETFLDHEIDAQVLRKLERCLYILESPHLRRHGSTWEDVLDNAYLYSRALATLYCAPEKSNSLVVSSAEWENCMRRMHKILNDPSNPRNRVSKSQSTDPEFGPLLLEGSPAMHTSSPDDFYASQRQKQWELLRQITTNQFTGLPPSAASVRALVNVLTRTLMYAPQSPLPLVELFSSYNHMPGDDDASLGHAIGIALTIARFADSRYEQVPLAAQSRSLPEAMANDGGEKPPHPAQIVYNKLATKQPTPRRTRALLTFGLLGLLDYPANDNNNFYDKKEIETISKALQTLETIKLAPHQSTILTHEDQYLRYLGYHKLMPTTPPTFDHEMQFKIIVMNWLEFWVRRKQAPGPYSPVSATGPNQETVAMYLEALLSPSRCRLFGSIIIDKLITVVFPPNDEPAADTDQSNQAQKHPLNPKIDLGLRAKKLCIRSITYSITNWPNCSGRQKQELHDVMFRIIGTGFYEDILSYIDSGADRNLIPHAMRFLWTFTDTLIKDFHPRENRSFSAADYRRVAEDLRFRSDVNVMGWTCVQDVGLEARWFELLRSLCDENPENVLESGLFDEIMKDRKGQQNRRPKPKDVAPSDQEKPLEALGGTWVDIYGRLKDLKDECETRVAAKNPPALALQEGPVITEEPIMASPRSEPEQSAGITGQGESDA